jgi:putative redox protein
MSEIPANEITAKLDAAQPYLVSLSAGSHTWLADEPETHGGGDRGPTPVELFLGSLGACTAITTAMYAQRKNWPLEHVSVSLAYRRLGPEEVASSGSTATTVSEISLRLKLVGPLTPEQRDRLAEIAGRCPVKRTVEGEVRFKSELVED